MGAGEPIDAINLYEEVVRRFGDVESVGVKRLVATALLNKGGVLIGIGRHKRAMDVLEHLVGRFQNSTDPTVQEDVASALLNQGVALTKLKELDRANRAFDQVVDLHWNRTARADLLAYRVANSLEYKAVNVYRTGHYHEALALVRKLINRFGTSSHPGINALVGRAMVIKGDSLGELQRHKKAIDVYQNALRYLEHLQGLEGTIASALNGIGLQSLFQAKRALKWGRHFEARGLLVRARNRLQEALHRTPNGSRLVPYILGNLGYTAFLRANTDEARDFLEKAIVLGGKDMRQAELKDTQVHPLATDVDFRRLIRSARPR